MRIGAFGKKKGRNCEWCMEGLGWGRWKNDDENEDKLGEHIDIERERERVIQSVVQNVQ